MPKPTPFLIKFRSSGLYGVVTAPSGSRSGALFSVMYVSLRGPPIIHSLTGPVRMRRRNSQKRGVVTQEEGIGGGDGRIQDDQRRRRGSLAPTVRAGFKNF